MAFNDFTAKQKEYIRNANKRWNIKSGATRSGKTYLDRVYTIPQRIRERRDKEGLSIILGVTKSTIERNILQPMRSFYTPKLVGPISSDNTCHLFGETVYCLGAEKISQQSKIRGASFKYVYGDEMAEWNEQVFNLLKTRLDQPYSCFDGTCNPKGPKHWVKKFIDSNPNNDVYYQPYTIFDNPTLDAGVVKSLCAEFQGTVDYQRYILGRWVAAEGACFPAYAENPERFRVRFGQIKPRMPLIHLGIDFGGNKSATSFVATGCTPTFSDVYVLRSRRLTGIITPQELDEAFAEFVMEVHEDFGRRTITAYADSAEQTLIAGLRKKGAADRLPCIVKNALKTSINDRIRSINRLVGAGRFWVYEGNEQVENALCDAVFDPKKFNDERLDDGTSDIDTCDALEYTLEPIGKILVAG